MKKLLWVPVLILLIIGVSCKTGKKSSKSKKVVYDTLSTASGIKYIIFSRGTSGLRPKQGDKVKAHYTGYLTNGTKFDSSVDRGEPFEFVFNTGSVIKGWDEGFGLLNEGDSALLILPPALAYGDRNLQGIPPNSTLLFYVKLVKVTQKVKPQRYDISGKKVLSTASGLNYVIVHSGNGRQAEVGKKVKVHYSGYLEDGNMFDSSVERGDPIEFVLGVGQVIKGWDEGIALMKVGDKFEFAIPPSLGYGDQNVGGFIPPNSTLIFDCELIEVKD